jgi:signal transduction histidine kinase
MLKDASKSNQVRSPKITAAELARENARLRGDLLTIASRISHDLRTPLGGVISAGEAMREILVENGLPPMLADSSLHSADDILKLIKRVSFVIKASLNPVRKEPVAMAEIVSGMLQGVEHRALKKHAVLTQPDAWPEVNGVPTWLEIIWWNLLTNALEHAGEAPRIELGWRAEADHFQFWISDNGSGVPPAKQAQLFRPFDSLHGLDSLRGLGLSIVQRLVELQGGICGYEPVTPNGSRFFFTLPLTPV